MIFGMRRFMRKIPIQIAVMLKNHRNRTKVGAENRVVARPKISENLCGVFDFVC
jgi:hypothetical protein